MKKSKPKTSNTPHNITAKETKVLDKFIFQQAKSYILDSNIEGVTKQLLKKYLEPEKIYNRPKSMPLIFERLLQSAQNARMKSSVIGRFIGGVNNLSIALYDFDHRKVLESYAGNATKLLDDIATKLSIKGKIRRAKNSIWPRYCESILSAASFLSNFKSSREFFDWIDVFDKSDIARPALPMLLSKEIYGFGFALSCDLLKEAGYINFPKPDVHLKDIFVGLGLCPPKVNDYILFKSIIRVAKNANVSPYTADRIFWLLGSGYFYNDPQIGKNGRVGSMKKQFIRDMKKII